MKTHRTCSLFACIALATFALFSCKKDKAPAGKTPTATGGSPTAGLRALKAPAKVAAFGGTDALKTMFDKLAVVGSTVSPAAAAVAAQVGPSLAKKLGLSSPDAFDLAGPAKFAVINPAMDNTPAVIMLSTKGEEAFVATMPKAKKKGDEGNAYSHNATQEGKRIYFNFIGKMVVIAERASVFGKHKDFLTKLAGAKAGDLVAVKISVANLRADYGSKLDKQIASFATNPAMKSASSVLTWLRDTAKEVGDIDVRLQAPAYGLRMLAALNALPGTKLAKSLSSLAGKPSPLVAKLPKNASVAMASALDPDATAPLISRMVAFMKSTAGDMKMPTTLYESVSAFWKSSDGQFAFALFGQGDKPAGIGIYGVRDAKAMNTSMETILKAYEDPKMAAAMSKAGLKYKLEVKRGAYEAAGVKVHKITQSISMPKMPKTGPMAAMMQGMTTSHVAIGEKAGVFGFLNGAQAAIEAFFANKLEGGLEKNPSIARAQKVDGAQAFAWVYIAVESLVSQVSAMMGQPRPAVADKDAVTVGFASAGGKLTVALDLPTSQLQAGVKAFGQIRAAMMGGMRGGK